MSTIKIFQMTKNVHKDQHSYCFLVTVKLNKKFNIFLQNFFRFFNYYYQASNLFGVFEAMRKEARKEAEQWDWNQATLQLQKYYVETLENIS